MFMDLRETDRLPCLQRRALFRHSLPFSQVIGQNSINIHCVCKCRQGIWDNHMACVCDREDVGERGDLCRGRGITPLFSMYYYGRCIPGVSTKPELIVLWGWAGCGVIIPHMISKLPVPQYLTKNLPYLVSHTPNS